MAAVATTIEAPPREGARALDETPELRAAAEPQAPGILAGYMARYGQWTEIDSKVEGNFLERFAEGSLRKTLQEGLGRIRVLFHHGRDASTGIRPLGLPVVLGDDAEGGFFEVELFDADYVRSLEPGFRAGVYGSSFRFRVIREEFIARPRRSERNPRGIPERTVLEAAVQEFGPTPFPAYAGTSAGMRSLTDELVVDRLVQDPERLAELLEHRHRTQLVVSAPLVGAGSSANGATSSALRTSGTIPAGAAGGLIAELREAMLPGRSPDGGGALEGLSRAVELESAARSRLYERCIDYVGATPWACHPEALSTIMAVLAERRAGNGPSDEEIAERIGSRAEPQEPASSALRVIRVYGPIVPKAGLMTATSDELTSAERIGQQLDAAMADPAVERVVMDIDSPGGSADLIPELADKIHAAAQEKPITAVANTWAASAAYWLGSQASELVVTPSGEVGSIGVWSAHTDISAAQELKGERVTLVSAGKYKVEGNPFEPLSEEAAAHMQERVDAVYEDFLAAVARGRGADVEDVRGGFGEGRMVRAEEAVAAGMADRVASLADVLAEYDQAPEAPEPATPAEPAPPSGAEPSAHSELVRRGTPTHRLNRKGTPSWRL